MIETKDKDYLINYIEEKNLIHYPILEKQMYVFG